MTTDLPRPDPVFLGYIVKRVVTRPILGVYAVQPIVPNDPEASSP